MTTYRSPRPIPEDDEIGTFNSGEPRLDNYLRNRALRNPVQGPMVAERRSPERLPEIAVHHLDAPSGRW